MGEEKESRFHYAFAICAVCCLVGFCTIGLLTGTVTAYLPYILETGHLSHTQGASLLTAKSIISMVTIFLVVDPLYRKISSRSGITLALLMGAGSFWLYSSADSYAKFLIASVVAGVAYGIGGIIPISIVIHRWFYKHASLAVGICTAGSGIAAIIVPLIFSYVHQRFSTRAAFLVWAAFLAAVALLVFLVVRDRPADKNKTPYGWEQGEIPPSTQAAVQKERLHLGKKQKWALTAVFLTGVVSYATNQYFGVMCISRGFSSTVSSFLISMGGIALTIGKMVYGHLSDLKGGRTTSLLFMASIQVGCLMTLFADPGHTLPMALAAILIFTGLAVGTVGVTVTAMDAANGSYTRMVKNCQLANLLGGVLGGGFPGVLADYTGSYQPVYVLMIFAGMLTMLAYIRCYREDRLSV